VYYKISVHSYIFRGNSGKELIEALSILKYRL